MSRQDTLRWLWRVTGRKKGYILALTLVQGATGVMGVLYALLFRAIVDSAVGGDAVAFRHNVTLIVGLVIAQLGVSAVLRWLYELARADIENALKQRLLDCILRKDFASVSATHTAEWLNRLTSDTTVVANGVVEILPGLASTVVSLVSALVMIVALDRWFAYLLVPGGVAMVLLSYAFRGAMKKLHKGVQESDGRLRIYLQERISSLMVVKAFAAEGQVGVGAAGAMADHKRARLHRNCFSNVANAGFGAAMNGMYMAGVVYCAHGIMVGRVSYGTLIAIMQLIGQVQGPFANISGYLPRWYAVTASVERLMEAESYADDPEPLAASEVARYYREDFRALGLRDVSFAYQGDGAPVVLRHLTMEVRKGETVAFTGHSGCGKSTVLRLLMCMYPPTCGERYLRGDGERPLTAAWRRMFAYVPQGNVLMNGTIRDAVCFAEDIDDDRLRDALSLACADEFVGDVDAELGESGSGLSEGQMQRLAIARAIYTDAPILLLDESTSALDEATERRLLENLRQLTDKTVVIVTHRRAALAICDRVLRFAETGVMEAGGGEATVH